MTDLLKSIGTNLNRARLEKGLSRQNLSAQLGISEGDLEGIEEGTKDFDVNFLPVLIKILDVDLNDLVSSESNRDKLLHLLKSKCVVCLVVNHTYHIESWPWMRKGQQIVKFGTKYVLSAKRSGNAGPSIHHGKKLHQIVLVSALLA